MDRDVVIGLLHAIVDEINDIIALLGGGDQCIDVIRRIQAVRAELRQVGLVTLEGHLTTCVAAVAQTEANGTELLDDIQDVFYWTNRLGGFEEKV